MGERILTHDNANEQPFTRSLSGLVIPDNISKVTIPGHDKINGSGGKPWKSQSLVETNHSPRASYK